MVCNKPVDLKGCAPYVTMFLYGLVHIKCTMYTVVQWKHIESEIRRRNSQHCTNLNHTGLTYEIIIRL